MADTIAQLSSTSRIAISLKKLQGKAHTKNESELYNEGLPSGITMDSSSVFGQRPPSPPNTNLGDITENIVEKVRLKCTFIPGSDSNAGRHGFQLSLLDDYETTSTNPKAGQAPFLNGSEIVASNATLQLVPPQYDYRYEARPYYGDVANLTTIPLTDPRDWNLDYFNGVLFQQDPPGTGDHAENPTYIDAYLYIGDYLVGLVEAAGQTGGGSDGAPSTATYITLSADGDLDNERVLSSDPAITISDQGSGNNVVLGIDDSVVATISGSAFSGDISAPNITASTQITAPRIDGNNLFLDDGSTPTIIGGNNINITVDQATGQRTISTLGGDSQFTATSPGHINTTNEVAFIGDLDPTTETGDIGTDVVFFVSGSADSNEGNAVFGGDVVVSGSIQTDYGINIGPVDNTDGIIDTFTPNTMVGDALSQINEMLKRLAPAVSPTLSKISEENNEGVNARLAFGTDLFALNYQNHSSAGGFSGSLLANSLFQKDYEENENKRIGVYSTSISQIGGVVGSEIDAFVYENGVVNYPAHAFDKGSTGALALELNGSTLYSINLEDSSIGAGNPGAGTGIHTNAFGSGFLSVSAPGFGKFQSGENLDLNRHRTATWRITRDDWIPGHNFARVVHIVNGVRNESNFVEWIYDAETSVISVSAAQIETQTYTDEVRVSGIKYFSTGSVVYACTVDNMYQNVYPAESNAISFVVGESAVQSIEINGQSTSTVSTGVPFIDVSTEDQSKSLAVKADVNLLPTDWLINESQSVAISITHPTKVDVLNTASVSTNGILMYQDLDTSNDVVEDFYGEVFRINPGQYDNQSAIAGEDWVSVNDLSAGGHLIVQAGNLLSPLAAINVGNFMNQDDGGIIANGPDNNVDYSGVTGELTYYRKIRNNTESTMFNLEMEIGGDGTLVGGDEVLDGNKFKMFMKLPSGAKTNGQTGWCDLTKDFFTAQYNDDDGLLKGKLDNLLPSTNKYTFGVNGVGIDEFVIIKIITDASWTGHISLINVTWDTVRYVFNY